MQTHDESNSRGMVDRLLARIGRSDQQNLQKLEKELLKAEGILGNLIDARNQHQKKVPKGVEPTIDEMNIEQLIEFGKTVDHEEQTKKFGAWKKVDLELHRRIMAARQRVSKAREDIAFCKWQPMKHHGDGLADKIAIGWRQLEAQIEELCALERMEFKQVGLRFHHRFSPRAVEGMQETIKHWINR